MKQQLLINQEVEGSIKLSQIETEKLVAYLVEEELKQRKKNGTYKGSFAPVSHFFGYQGRSGHPSLFDCSLGSTMGYAAGVLCQHRITGVAVNVSNVTSHPSQWRCGGVPILGLLDAQPKQGFLKSSLVVKSEMVNTNGAAFQQMKSLSKQWRIVDRYVNPGPI